MPAGLLALVLWLAAPSARAAGGPAKNPGTFVYGLAGEIDTLDPHWEFDVVSHAVQAQLYEGLLSFGSGGLDDVEPLLAVEVPTRANGLVSADRREYAFRVRRGVRFHDGGLLTPEDVKYSLLRCMLGDRAGGASYLLLQPAAGADSTLGPDRRPDPGLFGRLDAAVRVDGESVRLRLREPFPPLLSILASRCPIVSKPWTARRGGWDGRGATWTRYRDQRKQDAALYERANGTGPFKLARWDRPGRQLVLERHDGYWRGPARLARLVYKTVEDFALRKLMLQAGDLDAAVVERPFLGQIAALPGVVVDDERPALRTANAFIPTLALSVEGNRYVGSGRLEGDGIPPDFFADVEVRRGFADAFDADAYLKDVYGGKGALARGPIPPGLLGYDAAQPRRRLDPPAAQAHFRKAFGGLVWERGFKATLVYPKGSGSRQQACEIMKRGVESLNPKFRVDLLGLSFPDLVADLQRRRIPMVVARWYLNYPDPADSVYAFLHSRGFFARAQGYANPEADRLIESARVETRVEARRAAYEALQRLAFSEVPQIFTVDSLGISVRRAWVKGWFEPPALPFGSLYPVYKE